MKLFLAFVAICLLTFNSFAEEPKEVSSFSDGSTVNCVASANLGRNETDYSEKNIIIFYRIDRGQTEPMAYFRKVEKIGNYSFSGTCSKNLCELAIRDLRTNTVSTMNASYAKINNNTALIEIMNFSENITLSLACTLNQKK